MLTNTRNHLDCGWSVNETIARFPETTAVFNAHGIDTCCGGSLSVEEAARRAQVDPQRLCAALDAAIVPAPPEPRTAA
jgi:regulator of cell morphogenesis and NO signaling